MRLVEKLGELSDFLITHRLDNINMRIITGYDSEESITLYTSVDRIDEEILNRLKEVFDPLISFTTEDLIGYTKFGGLMVNLMVFDLSGSIKKGEDNG
jgi:hypothetical protein